MKRALCIAPILALIGCPSSTPDPGEPPASADTASSAGVPAASAPPSASPSAPIPAIPPITLRSEGAFDVVDLHVDTPWRVHFKGRDKTLPEGDATPDMLRRGHYAAIVYPIYIPDYIHDGKPGIRDADEIFDTIDAIVAANTLLAPAIGGAGGTRLTVPDDRVAVFVAIEGAGAFHQDVGQIERFVKRGVRLVGPVHARDNKLAGSATGAKGHGLTALGEDFCRRVYQAGALVDVSHMSDASFDDLVPIAAEFGAPIVATHSNARALAKHKRNLRDEQLKIIAQTGGIAGLNLHRSFVRGGKAEMKHVVAQVMHMVEVAGVDHVAIGSDFDGGTAVRAVADAGELPALAEALLAAGMSDQDVRKIFARNALRILYWKLP